MNLSKDMINIFTDYCYSMDEYFKDEKNKKVHKFLYDEYQVLNKNLSDLQSRYKL